MENQKKSNVFIVDGEEEICKIASMALEERLDCSVTFFNGAEKCLEILKNPQKKCSLLITDVKLPERDGISLLKTVKHLRPWLAVLIITSNGNISMAVKALKAGAMDFIEKPFDENILIPLIKIALERSRKANEIAGKPLTNSEREILKLIADGKSNSEMAAIQHRSVRTIERHRYLLMKKLNVNSPAELTKAAISLGLTTPDIS